MKQLGSVTLPPPPGEDMYVRELSYFYTLVPIKLKYYTQTKWTSTVGRGSCMIIHRTRLVPVALLNINFTHQFLSLRYERPPHRFEKNCLEESVIKLNIFVFYTVVDSILMRFEARTTY